MIKGKKILWGLASLLALSCSAPERNTEQLVEKPTISYEQRLRNATEISIREAWASIGKRYDILIGDDKVAEVTGKSFNLWADEFKLKTTDGTLIAYEKEDKRILRLSRNAACYDNKGNLKGYIGEEALKDFFSMSHIFHFYNANKTEIGKSKKMGNSAFFNLHDLYDSEGNVDYYTDKKFSLRDSYVLSVRDKNSSIPLEYAIFAVCIEDAICDSKESESSSSSSKKDD